jgi:serine O-acetyltransferase
MSNSEVPPFTDLVSAVLTSYTEEPHTRHIDAGQLPSRDTIIEIVQQLRELVFPGYFGKQDLASSTLEYHTGALLHTIQEKLLSQIRKAIRHQAARHGGTLADSDERAAVIVREFMSGIPKLRAVLATDVQAAFDGDPAASDTDEIIFSYPGLFAILVYRISHELYLRKVPLIPRIMSEYAHARTGVDIHPGATIDEYFFIDHGTGIVIGETVTIGKHVKIYQGVTLGALSTRAGQALKGVKRHPTLEDEVTVYSGASILGGETVIGQGAVISGNAFVIKSVPAQTRVSVKNPELQYRNQTPQEFKQDEICDWVI